MATAVLQVGAFICAGANDWTMGDWMPNPKVIAFEIKVVKSSPAHGPRKVHTAVGEVRRVVKGSINAKRVGIVLPIERYKAPPPVGARLFVMSASADSPFTPLWMMHGFVRLDEEGKRDVMPCAELSAKYAAAKSPAERAEILKEIAAVEQVSCGYEVASRLPAASCKEGRDPRVERAVQRQSYSDCLVEYGATTK